MTTLSDAKLTALETLTGNTGHVNDLEGEYLVSLGATASKALVDQWWEVFDAAAVPAGDWAGRSRAYIIAEVGTPPSEDQNEYWRFYWENVGGAPPGPQPPKSSNLQYWFDYTDDSVVFSDAAGTTPATDGDEVRRIEDKGTNGNPLIENTAFVPEYDENNPIGQNCAGLTGFAAEANPSLGGTTGVNGITFAAVMQRQASGGTLRDVWRMAIGVNEIRIRVDTIPLAATAGWQVVFNSNDIFAGEVHIGEWLYIIATINQATGAYEIRNGTDVFTGTDAYTSISPNTFQIGQLDGCVGEVLVYDVECTPLELDAIEAYFNTKYGTLPQTFLPLLPDLFHWYDFTDPSVLWQDTAGTIPIVAGQDILRVDDKGTEGTPILDDFPPGPVWELDLLNGHAGTLSVAGFPPNLQDALYAGASPPGPGVTIFSVGREGYVSGFTPSNHYLQAGGPGVMGSEADPSLVEWAGNLTGSPQPTGSGRAITLDEWVWNMVRGGPTNTFETSGTAPVFNVGPFTSPIAGTITLGQAKGSVMEVLVYGRELSAAEQAQVVGYLDEKYGVLPYLTPPATTADLIHHLDFTEAQTVWRNPAANQHAGDGDLIRVLDNLGSDGTSLTGAGGTSPTYRTGVVNGLNIAEYSALDLLDSIIAAGHASSVSGLSMSVVWRWRGAHPVGFPVSRVLDWPIGNRIEKASSQEAVGTYTGIGLLGSLGTMTVDTWYLFYLSSDAAGAVTWRMSGEIEQSAGPLGALVDIPPGSILKLKTDGYDIEIAEAAVWGGPLTASERAALTAYADAKYGTLPHV